MVRGCCARSSPAQRPEGDEGKSTLLGQCSAEARGTERRGAGPCSSLLELGAGACPDALAPNSERGIHYSLPSTTKGGISCIRSTSSLASMVWLSPSSLPAGSSARSSCSTPAGSGSSSSTPC